MGVLLHSGGHLPVTILVVEILTLPRELVATLTILLTACMLLAGCEVDLTRRDCLRLHTDGLVAELLHGETLSLHRRLLGWIEEVVVLLDYLDVRLGVRRQVSD